MKLIARLQTLLVLALTFRPASVFASVFEGAGGGATGTPDTQTGVDLLGPGATIGGEAVPGALQGSGIINEPSISTLIIRYINFLLPFLALAAFVGYVYAGVLYVMGFGNEDMTGKAKKILTYCTMGLVLIILSYTITKLFTVDLVEGIAPAA